MAKRRGLLLIDGKNLAYRAFFGARNSKAGQEVIDGYATMLPPICKYDSQADVLVCWDNGVPGVDTPVRLWRKDVDERYKAQRHENPDRVKVSEQLPGLVQFLDAARYPQIGVPGIEADDLIAIITRRVARTAIWDRVWIYSIDDDYSQLLECGNVTRLRPDKQQGYPVPYTREKFLAAWPGGTKQFVAVKALKGDSSDNVQGLKGCGDVTALAMVEAGFDPSVSWEQQPDSVRASPKYEKWADKWAASWGDAMLSYRLVRMPEKLVDLPALFENPIREVLGRIPGLVKNTVVSDSTHAASFCEWCAHHDLHHLISKRGMVMNQQPVNPELLLR